MIVVESLDSVCRKLRLFITCGFYCGHYHPLLLGLAAKPGVYRPALAAFLPRINQPTKLLLPLSSEKGNYICSLKREIALSMISLVLS